MSAEIVCGFGEDHISGLPDDIILIFLSRMGMKEAAKTSILSKRWRYLWAPRTHLDFDHFILFGRCNPDLGTCFLKADQESRYINWVNQVVDLHCSPCIDKFRVDFHFDFRSSIQHHFEKWVKFALLRKVKTLELNPRSCYTEYTLGFDTLKELSTGIGGDIGITSLTSLHLNNVNVSGDSIEFLLSKCRHLERLHVGDSKLLVRLNVVCKSLKQLEIDCCSNLEQLDIDALSLTHFDYRGRNFSTNLVLTSMPMLVDAAFGGTTVSIFQQISHLAANLYKLSIDMSLEYDTFPGGAIPTFYNLKHLNVVVEYLVEPIRVTPLLEACPLLHQLKLEIRTHLPCVSRLLEIIDQSNESDFEVYLDYFESHQTKRKTHPYLDLLSDGSRFEVYLDYLESEQIEFKTHPNLKLLEVVGFRGYDPHVDVTVSVLLSACNLGTIIFNLCNPTIWDFNSNEIARARARAQFQKIIPSKISVEIV